MKRIHPAHFPRLAALLVLLSPLGMLGMLSCAGMPEALQSDLEQAGGLVEIASPDSLRRAAALLSAPELAAYQEAASLGGLARLLHDFLYPERAGTLDLPASFTASPETEALFTLAASGRAPDAVPAGKEEPGYFDLLLPALYVARQPASGGEAAAALRAALDRAADLNPEALPPPYLSGLIAEALGDAAAARKLYSRCLELEASFYPAHRRLAELEHAAGNLEAAGLHLEALQQLGLAADGERRRLARVYLESGRPDEAEALTAAELVRSPGDRELLLLRAEILEARGDWLQALKPLELLLKQQPGDRAAQLKKAQLLAAYGRDPEDLLRYLRELDISADPELQELRGRTLLATGRHAEGLKQLEQVLERHPGRPSTLRILAADAVATQRWLQAEEYLAALPAGSLGEADLLLAHRVYGRLGDNRRALDIAARLYDEGGRPEHTLLYAESLLAAGRRAGLRAFITANLGSVAVESEQAGAEIKSGLYYLQAMLLPVDDPDRLRNLQFSLLAYPDNEKTLAAMAAHYRETGDLRKARNYLRHALALNPANASLGVQLRQLGGDQ
jgi:Tfp pilus assembly protein PilF